MGGNPSSRGLLHPQGCTVILIAHRLSTVRAANVIAVINDGRVIEQGTHEQLLQIEDGLYAKLVAKQAERTADALPETGCTSPLQDIDVDKLFDRVLGAQDHNDGSSSSERSGGSDASGEGASSSSDSSSNSSESEE